MNERLAAHRTRRGGVQDASTSKADAGSPRAASSRAAEAAARVAARYAKAPSYSQLLAGEARAVVRAAGAAAEAARSAQAAAQAVLAGLEAGPAEGFWDEPQAATVATAQAPAATPAAPARWQDEPPVASQVELQESTRAVARPVARPRWEETLPAPPAAADRDVWSEMRVHPTPEVAHDYKREPVQQYRTSHPRIEDETELFAADTYQAFDAMASAMVEPVQHLPANLIEFPKELTATRKARPRLAEGPFYDASHEQSQLNIFEVDPELLAPPIAMQRVEGEAVAPPEWASIELDHASQPSYHSHRYDEHSYAEHAYVETANLNAEMDLHHVPVQEKVHPAMEAVPQAAVAHYGFGVAAAEPRTSARVAAEERPARKAAVKPVEAAAVELLVAPFSDRMLATVVDGALVTLAFLAAAVVVIASTAHPPTGRIALIASACGLLLFGLLYQFLFLSYAEEGTPGMRYARIALCTFDDDNPSREQMRRRIPAMLLAAAPAGLGLLWALFDGEHLGWHDRLTKTYQRKY